jgi:energy-converting hydrogenase A subunit M
MLPCDVIEMDDDAKLRLMQKRIIKSYAWQRDIIVPLSKEFDCSIDELEEVLFNSLDMSSLEALHATFESAQDICLYQKLNADLRLCWFVDSLELISREDARNLKMKVVEEIKNGKSYEEALKEGQLEVFELLKKEAIY